MSLNALTSFFRSLCQLEKLPREKIESELAGVGVPSEAIEGILQALTLQCFDDLEGNASNVISM